MFCKKYKTRIAELEARLDKETLLNFELKCEIEILKFYKEAFDSNGIAENLAFALVACEIYNEKEDMRKENADLHMRLGIASQQLSEIPRRMKIFHLINLDIDPTLKPALVKIINASVCYLDEIMQDHVISAGYKKNTWTKIVKLKNKYK